MTIKNAADRIRPILAAMDRSIDAARRRRVATSPVGTLSVDRSQHGQPLQAARPLQSASPARSGAHPLHAQPAAMQPSPQPAQQHAHDQLIGANADPSPRTEQRPVDPLVDADDPDQPPVLKARPKRPNGLGANNPNTTFRSQAG